jgi:hypothetical protein
MSLIREDCSLIIRGLMHNNWGTKTLDCNQEDPAPLSLWVSRGNITPAPLPSPLPCMAPIHVSNALKLRIQHSGTASQQPARVSSVSPNFKVPF